MLSDMKYSYWYMTELLSSFILGSGIQAAVSVDQNGNQSMNFFILLICVYIAILVSEIIGGSDLNPAVTLSRLFAYEKENKEMLRKIILMTCIMQFVGFLSAFLLWGCLSSKSVFLLTINPEITPANGFFMEIFCSTTMYLILLIIDKNEEISHNFPMKVFCQMAAVGTGICIGGTTSGAGLNPAVGLGANVTRFLFTGNINEIKYLWIYIFAPFIASYLSASIFLKIRRYYPQIK